MSGRQRLPDHEAALAEWNRRTADLEVSALTDLPFTDVFEQALPHGPLDCLEVGAIPGRFLASLARSHGYRVTGIDFAANEDIFHETMAAHGVVDYEFIHADFFSYDFTQQFDVVVSFGFIEHFEDIGAVIRRHCDLVAPNGYLVLSVPNFRFLRYPYHFVFDHPNLAFHNLKAMDQGRLERHLGDLGFERVVSTYYGKMMFWRESELPAIVRLVDAVIRRAAAWAGRFLPVSKWISPYLILVYRRPGTSGPSSDSQVGS